MHPLSIWKVSFLDRVHMGYTMSHQGSGHLYKDRGRPCQSYMTPTKYDPLGLDGTTKGVMRRALLMEGRDGRCKMGDGKLIIDNGARSKG